MASAEFKTAAIIFQRSSLFGILNVGLTKCQNTRNEYYDRPDEKRNEVKEFCKGFVVGGITSVLGSLSQISIVAVVGINDINKEIIRCIL